MSGISITRSILACACVVAALAGCKKTEAPATPTVDSSSSVAAPSEAMPPSEAVTPTGPTSTGDASTGDASSGPAQSDPSELSKRQESLAMPLPGQTNNHSTVTPEKEK